MACNLRQHGGAYYRFDKWLQRAVGRLPAHVVERFRNDLTINGPGSDHRSEATYQYEIVGVGQTE